MLHEVYGGPILRLLGAHGRAGVGIRIQGLELGFELG